MSVGSHEEGDGVRSRHAATPGGARGAGLRQVIRRIRDGLPAYARDFEQGLTDSLPAFVLFLALSAIFSHFKPLAFFDAWVMGEIAALRTVTDAARADATALQIEQLEIGPEARVARFEQKDVHAGSEVVRVGGVAPIDREQMAESLRDVAAALAATAVSSPPALPPIVAVDVDLAPLGRGATPQQHVDAMHHALDALREHAHVIAVVLPRLEVSSRLERNAFMAKSCTGHAEAMASRRSAPQTQPTAPQGTPPRHGLHFASARLFHRAGEPPMAFPHEMTKTDEADNTWPPIFPSLGTLIDLRHRIDAMPSDGPWARLMRWFGVDDRAGSALLTLTALCEQARRANLEGADTRLLEDRFLDKNTPASDEFARYEQLFFNWRLLDSTQMRYTVVPTVDDLVPAVLAGAPMRDEPRRRVLLIGIDGGARHDKFDIAGISAEPVSGAALHGLQALSIDTRLAESSWVGLLFDVAVGLSFVLVWSLLSPLLSRSQKVMPTLAGWCTAVAPAVLAGLFIVGSVHAAAALLETDLWLNPAYLIVGLALDAYLEAWRQARPHASPGRAGRWMFGVDSALAALRRGYGARVRRVGVFFTMKRGEWRSTRQAVYEPSRGFALADELLCTLLRLTVLAVGIPLLLLKLLEG
jgi:hypothetical protein